MIVVFFHSYVAANCLDVYSLRKGGGLLPYKRLMGMCRWMGSHFLDWIDYNWVALMGLHIFDFEVFFIFTVSKRTGMFVPYNKSGLLIKSSRLEISESRNYFTKI